jgi:NADH-quinone oxidoreductase subunit M
VLTLTIFLPLAAALLVLALPRRAVTAIRWTTLAAAIAVLVLSLVMWAGLDAGGGLQWRQQVAWIPGIGASYDVAVDGLSLPLFVLTGIILTAVTSYTLYDDDRPTGHASLLLLITTGLLGVFAAQDLLLFYLFFEIALVPMYLIIGAWGSERRRYSAMKFFLYTRAASLFMLLGFLALYLTMEPHTFSIPEIVAANPFAEDLTSGILVFLALLLGFGVKLPMVPVHNWLPDAHVEAPTEGSVILAALQLKMGAYGLLRIALPMLPDAARELAWLLFLLAVLSLLWGALAALAQKDAKRLIAYTSVNHMGYVTLALPVAAVTTTPEVRDLAINGAIVQMVSHGLLTGGMFLVVGVLQRRLHTRDIDRIGGIAGMAPVYAAITGVLAFGSLGLPGLSGFIAEFQVIAATLREAPWAAVLTILSLIVTTGLYLKLISRLLLGEPTAITRRMQPMATHETTAVVPLMLLSLLIGIVPAVLIAVTGPTAATLLAAN